MALTTAKKLTDTGSGKSSASSSSALTQAQKNYIAKQQAVTAYNMATYGRPYSSPNADLSNPQWTSSSTQKSKATTSSGGTPQTVYLDYGGPDLSAYNDALADLDASNAKVLALLKKNYDNSVNSINGKYDLTQKTQEADSANALREAYVNYMMNRRNIDGDLNRSGMNGGVAESTRAKMYNNYGNNRNALRTVLQNRLAEINLGRNEALNTLENEYNNAVAKQTMDSFNRRAALRQAMAAAMM